MKSFSITSLWKEAISLLQPSSASCVFCSRSIITTFGANAENVPQLPAAFHGMVCAACRALIPWVQRIICPVCGRGEFCPDCVRRTNAHFICNRSAVRYDDHMRAWLALYKYRGHERLEDLFADMMIPALQQMSEWLGRYDRSSGKEWGRKRLKPHTLWDAVTYVPVSRERAEERGFNQAERLAHGICLRTGLPEAHLLHRTRHSGKQSYKTRGERLDNTKQLFAADPAGLMKLPEITRADRDRKVKRLLLVDDIYTTGSTIEACSEALQQAAPFPLEIYALTWARS